MMKLYNTVSREIEEIVPLHDSEVTVYTCGPTVYDYPHIGNWFTFIRYDLLVRTLKASGLDPKWVLNITDVGHLVSDADEGEDKLEKGAKREGKTAWDVATFYSDYFVQGLERLHISQPSFMPKATEHIPEQIELIKKLEEKGYTYIINDGVYYDTSKFEGYAAFARLDLDDQQAGARVAYNQQKRNPSDFALWKFSPKDMKRDMEWDSPWGKGFPGWHLECSAMCIKYLGETIDIHAGGIDHVPVHHTNEIAQSEAVSGKRFANYWMHANHITIEGEKISKSLGNTITLEEIEKQGISLEAFRLHVFESHYRSQSKFSWDSLRAAQNRLSGLYEMAALRWQMRENCTSATSFSLNGLKEQLLATLQHDLDTPQFLAKLSEATTQLTTLCVRKELEQEFIKLLEFLDSVLGLNLSQLPDITIDQKALIAEREQARSQQDWSKSDELRARLQEQDIEVRDTDLGTIWYRPFQP
jgi:cysteinyl-tRNA synthetase